MNIKKELREIRYCVNSWGGELKSDVQAIKRHLNLTGTERSCVGGCGRFALHNSNFCEYYFTATGLGCEPEGTAGDEKPVLEKIFHGTSEELSEWLLKQTMHGGEAWAKVEWKKPERKKGFHESPTVPGIIEEATPDLPLNAKVAKASGNEIRLIKGEWYYWNPHAHGLACWRPIPDYPNDRNAAIGALEEYAEKHCSIYIIRRNRAGDCQIVLYPPMTSDNAGWYDGLTLPQAICEAIVKHAESS